MGVITYTRPAKCKDCEHCQYYYEGKRKFHKCVKKDRRTTLNESASLCVDRGDFKMRESYYPKRLDQ